MEDPDTLQRRITELEIKLGFAEDLLERLNRVVFEQQRQIEALAAQLVQLRNQPPDEGGTAWRSLRDELPPHY